MKLPEVVGLGIDLGRTHLDKRLPKRILPPDLFRRDVVLRSTVTQNLAEQLVWVGECDGRLLPGPGHTLRFGFALHKRTIAQTAGAADMPASSLVVFFEQLLPRSIEYGIASGVVLAARVCPAV